jgi:hypothetical protein
MNVAATFASVLPVVLFRSFPFAFSVCATRRATLPFRVSIITTFLAAIIIEFRFGRERLYDVAWVPVVYLYFLGSSGFSVGLDWQLEGRRLA